MRLFDNSQQPRLFMRTTASIVLCLLLSSLLLPMMPVSANLVDAGQTEQINDKVVAWEQMSDGKILMVTGSGILSVNTFEAGTHTEVWSLDLNVTANSATIDAGENLARLEYGEAHIALRAGPKPDHPDYVVSKFAQINFNLYAHQSYIQRFGMPKDTDDFDNHQFVLPPKFGGNLSVREWIQNIIRPDMIALSTQHVNVNFKAVLAGIGIGFIEDYKAKMFGGFHRVLAPNQEWSVPIWLVTHVDLHRTAKVQAMLRCIKSARQEE